MASITVFSGYRLRFIDPQFQQAAQQILSDALEPFIPVMELIDEPYLLDDTMRGIPAVGLLWAGLANGEFIVCMDEDRLIGFVWLQQIVHQRSAYIEAWATPDYRQDFKGRKIMAEAAKQVIDYAFRPLGPVSTGGLGLVKLKARAAITNRAAIRAMCALGFKQTGCSPLDGLFYSVPTDMVELELLNPRVFGVAEPEATQNHGQRQQATSAPDVSEPGTVSEPRPVSITRRIRSTNKSGVHSPASADTDAGDKPRKRSRRTTAKRTDTAVAPIGEQPDGPGGTSPGRTELVSTKRSASTRRRTRASAK